MTSPSRRTLAAGVVRLQFPNAIVLNAVGCRNMLMSAKERKGALPRKNCKQPGLRQPGWELPDMGALGPQSKENLNRISPNKVHNELLQA